MNEQMQNAMGEALRLTREGRLAEATSVIQRTLGGDSGRGPRPGDEDTIDVVSRVVGGGPVVEEEPASPEDAPGVFTFRQAPKPPRTFRDARRSPAGWIEDLPGFESPMWTPSPEEDPSVGGRFIRKSFRDGPVGREYKLYVPGGYVGQAVPLVVMLHGCTQTPDDFAAGTGMNALAEERTFLVAYPAQASGANISKCWNWYEAANQERGRGEPAAIAGITGEICREYRVDDGKVCVAGMSSGGAMAAIMGEEYPDLYAAVGVHSGLAPGSASDLSSAFQAMRSGAASRRPLPADVPPMIVFHGDRDSTVHSSNAKNVLERWKTRAPTDVAEKRESGQAPGGKRYTRVTYTDGANASGAESWTVSGLGHAWSGGSSSGSYTDPSGPDASAEMVRFFEQYS